MYVRHIGSTVHVSVAPRLIENFEALRLDGAKVWQCSRRLRYYIGHVPFAQVAGVLTQLVENSAYSPESAFTVPPTDEESTKRLVELQQVMYVARAGGGSSWYLTPSGLAMLRIARELCDGKLMCEPFGCLGGRQARIRYDEL